MCAPVRQLKVVVVGAGFGGIGAVIELRRHGFQDVTILERGAGIGGTWYYNTYPGSACDVPSPLYSFSFAQRRHWSRFCSLQEEILDYLRDVVREFGLENLVVPDTEVVACTWDDGTRRWLVTSADGRSWEADAVVMATGQLHRPAFPDIEGRETYEGRSFHSAEWDHGFDLRGKKVAVIGTGASAAQFVPAIVDTVDKLVVFQRTGNWFLPRKNRPYSRLGRTILGIPMAQTLRRRLVFYGGEGLSRMVRHPRTCGRLGHWLSAGFMRWQLRDRQLRRKVWPAYTFGCKRVLFSSLFLRSLQRGNVELVTESVSAITPTGLVTADGVERAVDCIIYGTGFRTTEFMFPMEIVGAHGRTLREAWAKGPHAHLGITVPGFPSLFLIYGPNTNTLGGSVIVYQEAQAAYLRQALEHVRDLQVAAVDVRPEVAAESDRALQARFAGTAWTQCQSWYRNREGRHVANWPGSIGDYMGRTRLFDSREYTFIPLPDRHSPLS